MKLIRVYLIDYTYIHVGIQMVISSTRVRPIGRRREAKLIDVLILVSKTTLCKF